MKKKFIACTEQKYKHVQIRRYHFFFSLFLCTHRKRIVAKLAGDIKLKRRLSSRFSSLGAVANVFFQALCFAYGVHFFPCRLRWAEARRALRHSEEALQGSLFLVDAAWHRRPKVAHAFEEEALELARLLVDTGREGDICWFAAKKYMKAYERR